MASYATPTQLLSRFRSNTINELVNDDGVRQSPQDLLNNENVSTALADASGAIEAALLVGNRYTTEELEELTGNSASHLQRITCEIAMAYLYARNPAHNLEVYTEFREIASKYLDDISNGGNTFNIADKTAAGLPTINGPSVTDYARKIRSLPDRTNRFYPNRAQRLPITGTRQT